MDFSFRNLPASDVSDNILKECAKLFSNNYGVWGAKGPKPGQSVKINLERLRAQCMFDNCCRLATVAKNNQLAGQAFFRKFKYDPSGGNVVWITQLVISKDYRNLHLARKLLSMACSDKNLFACALATSHPYAVRALESAVGKQCDIIATAHHAERIIRHSEINYLQNCPLYINPTIPRCVIDNGFYVSHKEADNKREQLYDWKLGNLEEGEEFIAIVFP